MLFMFIVFCSMGFLGMSCFAALTKKFGALTSAITSTTRKGLTLVLSYICFPSDKSITWGHFFGASVFLGGLLLKSIQKSDTPRHHNDHDNINNNNSNSNSLPSPKGDEEWNIPFGVKNRMDNEGTKTTRRRPIVVVGGSVHCEGEAGGGIGGLGLEIETDDEDDSSYENYNGISSNNSPGSNGNLDKIDIEGGLSGIIGISSMEKNHLIKSPNNSSSGGGVGIGVGVGVVVERLNSREKIQQNELNQLQNHQHQHQQQTLDV